MKKNIAIALLSLLCIGSFVYGLIQKIEAQKQAEIAIIEAKKAVECQARTEQAAKRAQELFNQTRKMVDEEIARQQEIECES
jgi:acetyl-CoA carboxylase carboxyltransferase component